jgi:hypothetical protein
MKKMIIGLFAVLVCAGLASADTRTVTMTVTNGQAATYSDPISIAGELESVIISQADGGAAYTSTVVIANYVDTTAVDTYVSLTDLATATKLVRPVFLPTANTGTALAGVVGSGSSALTNIVTTVLNVPYKTAVLGGGNIKMAVSGCNTTSGTNTITATIYFKPLR